MTHWKHVGLLIALGIGLVACGGDGSADVDDAATPADGGNVGDDAAVSADGGHDGSTPPPIDAGPPPNCEPLDGEPAWIILDPGLDGLESPATDAPLSRFDGLAGVAYGAGRFVAIGYGVATQEIRWATSEDGETWTEHELENDVDDTEISTSSKVKFLGERFVFFAYHSNNPFSSTNGGYFVYSSIDGLSWTHARIDPNGLTVDEFDWSGSRLVTGGRNGDTRTSTDLVTWAAEPAKEGNGFAYKDVAYGNGRWVTTTNGAGEVFGSSDGVEWTLLENIGTAGGYTVEYGNGIWIAQGSPYRTSTDGISFDEVTPTGSTPGTAARFAGGRFLSYVQAYWEPGVPAHFRASTDGVAWTDFGTVPEIGAGGVFGDIAYGRCRYVAAGQYVKDGTRQPLIAVAAAHSSTP